MTKKFSNVSQEEINNLHTSIARNVKYLRLKHKLSLMDLSLDLGFRSSTFLASAEISKNNKHFNIEHLYKLSKIFNVPIEYFFSKEI